MLTHPEVDVAARITTIDIAGCAQIGLDLVSKAVSNEFGDTYVLKIYLARPDHINRRA